MEINHWVKILINGNRCKNVPIKKYYIHFWCIYYQNKPKREVRLLPFCEAGLCPGRLPCPSFGSEAPYVGREPVWSSSLVRALLRGLWRTGATGSGMGQGGAVPGTEGDKAGRPPKFKRKGGEQNLAIRSFGISDIYFGVYFCSLQTVYTIKLGKFVYLMWCLLANGDLKDVQDTKYWWMQNKNCMREIKI